MNCQLSLNLFFNYYLFNNFKATGFLIQVSITFYSVNQLQKLGKFYQLIIYLFIYYYYYSLSSPVAKLVLDEIFQFLGICTNLDSLDYWNFD